MCVSMFVNLLTGSLRPRCPPLRSHARTPTRPDDSQACKCMHKCCCAGDDDSHKGKKDKHAEHQQPAAYDAPKGQDPAVRANAV